MISGKALSGQGSEQGSMGVDWVDMDHGGRLDLFVSTFTQEPKTLYWNRGAEGFEDISGTAGLALPTAPYVGWGTALFDADNDGWVDIIVANGHVYPQMDQVRMGVPYRQPLLLFRNKRDRTFQNISAESGLESLPLKSRRGLAIGDVNNDGKLDVLLLNLVEPPTSLLNLTQPATHPALFRLTGTKSNRAAIGARVTVLCGQLMPLNHLPGRS